MIDVKKLFSMLVILFLVSSCGDAIDNRELYVFNESDSYIFSIISPNDKINGSHYYNEYASEEIYYDALKNDKMLFVFSPIMPGETEANHDRPRSWNSFFDKASDKKLKLFIIDADSVKKYGWVKIFEKNIYNKKYVLTKKELNKCDWKISFNR